MASLAATCYRALPVRALGGDEELGIVELDGWQILLACDVGCKRRLVAMRAKRSEPHGTPETDLWGNDIESSAAEYAASLVLGLPWRMEIKRNLRPAPPDVGDDVEVRCTHHEHGYLPVYKRDDRSRRFVLVTGRIPRLRVVGMIDGARAMDESYWGKSKRGEWCFKVPQSALEPIAPAVMQ